METAMQHFIPATPWQNSVLPETRLTARIEGITSSGGEDGGDELLEITFWIFDEKKYLKTRIYLPRNFSNRCQMRLKFFCYALGLHDYELNDDPQAALGKELIIELETICDEKANNGCPYSDVKKFLPNEVLVKKLKLNIS